MEFDEKWLEVVERFISSFEKMVAMEEKRWELMSKPITPVSITPTDIIPIDKMATPNTIKIWYEGLDTLSDSLSKVDEIDKGKGFEHLIVALRIITDEMKVYLAVNK